MKWSKRCWDMASRWQRVWCKDKTIIDETLLVFYHLLFAVANRVHTADDRHCDCDSNPWHSHTNIDRHHQVDKNREQKRYQQQESIGERRGA